MRKLRQVQKSEKPIYSAPGEPSVVQEEGREVTPSCSGHGGKKWTQKAIIPNMGRKAPFLEREAERTYRLWYLQDIFRKPVPPLEEALTQIQESNLKSETNLPFSHRPTVHWSSQ
ncbi:hypothetical protein P7K49_022553 [Saguinus oedipus]|uniref:Uncharacterized protein n=1 Tax=Saguinus oedipus TaxID=9490 RepID=A0ABQ9UWS5_SAGOE|nr:hypothetical protein P7K49_022553 [Saguinus oedipus]